MLKAPLKRKIIAIESFLLHHESATERIACALARCAKPGDVIGLSGAVGTGKSSFARAFIHYLTDEQLIPSPTFTLVQIYDRPEGKIVHADLYRLQHQLDLEPLDLEGDSTRLLLIEWPERMGDLWPENGLWLEFSFTEDESIRRVTPRKSGERWAGYDFHALWKK